MDKMQRVAANFLSLLNDLKRNDAVAAAELGVPLTELQSWLRGDQPIPESVRQKAATIWAVNLRDLEIIDDDAPTGVRIMRAAESESTERVLFRAGSPYYAYRDTAMSRTAAFRPEWIQELVDVSDDSPDNPKVQWNNGHFLHQFTYFIGPVNFYYLEDGVRRVARMNTGDTMYISPFVPHSFTTRTNSEGQKGLILALTFGGRVFGDTQQEISILGQDFVTRLCENGARGTSAILARHAENALLSAATLAERSGIAEQTIQAFMTGDSSPSAEDLQALASALHMNVRDLLPFDRAEPAVVLRSTEECQPRNTGGYLIKDLASTSLMPDMRSFEMEVPALERSSPSLETSLFQYAYVLGDQPVHLTWTFDGRTHTETLNPDDSFVMKPGVSHSFACHQGSAKLLLLRIGGRLSNEVILELSNLSPEGVARVVKETQPWYNAAGKNYSQKVA